ncbi:hypothetical protein Q7P37_010428 [Cladosporium fusiforme]
MGRGIFSNNNLQIARNIHPHNNGGGVVYGPNNGFNNAGPVNDPWTYAPTFSPYHGGYNPVYSPSYSSRSDYRPSYLPQLYAPPMFVSPYWGMPSYDLQPYPYYEMDDYDPGHRCTSVIQHCCHGSGRRRGGRGRRAMRDPYMLGYDPFDPFDLFGDPWDIWHI